MPEKLTRLQEIILEIDKLDLTVRDSIKQVSARVGYFVGQNKYLEELAKARAIEAEQPSPRSS